MSARDLAATVRLVALARETTRGRHPHQDCVATAATVDALADALEAAEARAVRAEEALRQIAQDLKDADDNLREYAAERSHGATTNAEFLDRCAAAARFHTTKALWRFAAAGADTETDG